MRVLRRLLLASALTLATLTPVMAAEDDVRGLAVMELFSQACRPLTPSGEATLQKLKRAVLADPHSSVIFGSTQIQQLLQLSGVDILDPNSQKSSPEEKAQIHDRWCSALEPVVSATENLQNFSPVPQHYGPSPVPQHYDPNLGKMIPDADSPLPPKHPVEVKPIPGPTVVEPNQRTTYTTARRLNRENQS